MKRTELQRRTPLRRKSWWRSAIVNTAKMGWFSSDRTIADYAEEIWNVPTKRG